MGYDQNFSRCSPGELLFVESLRLAAERGMEAYEFTGTPESWTQKWTSTAHSSAAVRIYAEGMRGMIGVAAETTRIAARRAITALRNTNTRLKPARKKTSASLAGKTNES